jgi:hypothetical protein
VNRHFRGTYYPYLQGKKSAEQETSVLLGRILIQLIFDLEDDWTPFWQYL